MLPGWGLYLPRPEQSEVGLLGIRLTTLVIVLNYEVVVALDIGVLVGLSHGIAPWQTKAERNSVLVVSKRRTRDVAGYAVSPYGAIAFKIASITGYLQSYMWQLRLKRFLFLNIDVRGKNKGVIHTNITSLGEPLSQE